MTPSLEELKAALEHVEAAIDILPGGHAPRADLGQAARRLRDMIAKLEVTSD